MEYAQGKALPPRPMPRHQECYTGTHGLSCHVVYFGDYSKPMKWLSFTGAADRELAERENDTTPDAYKLARCGVLAACQNMLWKQRACDEFRYVVTSDSVNGHLYHTAFDSSSELAAFLDVIYHSALGKVSVSGKQLPLDQVQWDNLPVIDGYHHFENNPLFF